MEENRNSAISVRNVCIDYKSLKTGSIKENLFKIKKVEQEIFHAVRNVSFEVPEGQILGITGKNGSGKSTMLRAIAGIFSADSGEIDLHGHTISLLSIGVGFKNELSGRENIILSGMLLLQRGLNYAASLAQAFAGRRVYPFRHYKDLTFRTPNTGSEIKGVFTLPLQITDKQRNKLQAYAFCRT